MTTCRVRPTALTSTNTSACLSNRNKYVLNHSRLYNILFVIREYISVGYVRLQKHEDRFALASLRSKFCACGPSIQSPRLYLCLQDRLAVGPGPTRSSPREADSWPHSAVWTDDHEMCDLTATNDKSAPTNSSPVAWRTSPHHVTAG